MVSYASSVFKELISYANESIDFHKECPWNVNFYLFKNASKKFKCDFILRLTSYNLLIIIFYTLSTRKLYIYIYSNYISFVVFYWLFWPNSINDLYIVYWINIQGSQSHLKNLNDNLYLRINDIHIDSKWIKIKNILVFLMHNTYDFRLTRISNKPTQKLLDMFNLVPKGWVLSPRASNPKLRNCSHMSRPHLKAGLTMWHLCSIFEKDPPKD